MLIYQIINSDLWKKSVFHLRQIFKSCVLFVNYTVDDDFFEVAQKIFES